MALVLDHSLKCGTGICVRYKASIPPFNQSRYKSGQKRCSMCDIFIKFDGLWCPCCGYKLRTHSRSD